MNKEHKILIIIFFIALGLRFILFLGVGPWKDEVLKERIHNGDAYGYHMIAINLLENNVFSRKESSPYVPAIFRTPIYPFFLASVYAIFGYEPYIAIIFNLIFGSLTCVLLFKIGKICFNRNIALLAALLLSFEYSSIYYSNLLLTDTLFTLLFLVCIFFIIKFLKNNNVRELIYSAIFLGLSTLTRPVSIYFIIFLFGIFFIHFRKYIRIGILNWVIITSVYILIISPWVVRNYLVSGRLLVSSAQEKVLNWNLPSITKSHQVTKEAQKRYGEIHEPIHNIIKSIYKNPIKLRGNGGSNAIFDDSKKYLKGMIWFFLNVSSSTYPIILGLPSRTLNVKKLFEKPLDTINIIILNKSKLELFIICLILLFLFFAYSTMCVGIFIAIKIKKYTVVILFLSIIMYFALASSFSSSARFRMPIMPYVILLSSYGMVQLQIRFNKYKMRIRTV